MFRQPLQKQEPITAMGSWRKSSSELMSPSYNVIDTLVNVSNQSVLGLLSPGRSKQGVLGSNHSSKYLPYIGPAISVMTFSSSQKLSEEETVLNKILFLYIQSFPDHPLSKLNEPCMFDVVRFFSVFVSPYILFLGHPTRELKKALKKRFYVSVKD